MNINDYQNEMMRTAGEPKEKYDHLINACLGLSGEAGEINDYIKKFLFQGHSLSVEKLSEEIGDVMWYISLLCNFFEISLSDVLSNNIDKLKKRYPDGFDENKSINRVV